MSLQLTNIIGVLGDGQKKSSSRDFDIIFSGILGVILMQKRQLDNYRSLKMDCFFSKLPQINLNSWGSRGPHKIVTPATFGHLFRKNVSMTSLVGKDKWQKIGRFNLLGAKNQNCLFYYYRQAGNLNFFQNGVGLNQNVKFFYPKKTTLCLLDQKPANFAPAVAFLLLDFLGNDFFYFFGDINSCTRLKGPFLKKFYFVL